MLTFLSEQPITKKETRHFREVALDDSLQWLEPQDQGFKAFGVSASVVFVVYYGQNLFACQHWGFIPGSSDPQHVVSQYVDEKFNYLENALKEESDDLTQFTIYAVGAQESSQNLIDELRRRKNTTSFNFNTDNLHLVHGEDTFDFYAQRGAPMFFGQHYPETMEQETSATILIKYTNASPVPIETESDQEIQQINKRLQNTTL